LRPSPYQSTPGSSPADHAQPLADPDTSQPPGYEHTLAPRPANRNPVPHAHENEGSRDRKEVKSTGRPYLSRGSPFFQPSSPPFFQLPQFRDTPHGFDVPSTTRLR
jgi:hypothetical protein